MWNEDDRKWLYDTMSRNGVDTGSYEEFTESLNNKEDRDWYYNKSLSLGLNVGSAEDFDGMMIQPQEKAWWQTEVNVPKAESPYAVNPVEFQAQVDKEEKAIAERLPQANAAMSQRMLAGQTTQGAFNRFLEGDTYAKMGTPEYARAQMVQSRHGYANMPAEAREKLLEQMGGKENLSAEFAKMNGRQPKDEMEVYEWMTGGYAVRPEYATEDTPANDIAKYNGYSANEINAGMGDEKAVALYTKDILSPQLKAAQEKTNAMLKERDAEIEAANREREAEMPWFVRAGANMSKGGTAGMPSYVSSNNGRYTDQEWKMLSAAANINRETEQLIDAAVNDRKFFTGFGRTIANIDTWFPLMSGLEMSALMELKNVDPEKASPAQKALMEALALRASAEASYAGDISNWYKVGEGAANMIPLMGEMAFNPLSGVGKAAAKKVAKGVMKSQTKKALAESGKTAMKQWQRRVLAKGTGGFLGSLAGGAGMAATTSLPKVAVNAGLNSLGQAQYDINAGGIAFGGMEAGDGYWTEFGREFARTAIEHGTEQMGAEWLSKAIGKPLKWIGKGVSKIPGVGKGVTRTAQFLDNTFNPKKIALLKNLAKDIKYDGPLDEFGEEFMSALLTRPIDDDSLQKFFEKDNLLVTLGTVTIPFVAGATVAGGYNLSKGNYKAGAREKQQQLAAYNKAVNSFGENQQEWRDISFNLNNADTFVDEMQRIYNSPDYTEEQKKNALEYAVHTLRYMAATGSQIDLDENTQMLNGMLRESYGWAYDNTNPAAVNGNMVVAADKALRDAEAEVRRFLVLSEDADVDAVINGRSVDEVAMGDDAVAEALRRYYAEKALFEGMQDKMQDTRENEYLEADKGVDAVAHKVDGVYSGNIYRTTLSNTGEEIYITGGKVVLDNEGFIDVNQSEGLVALMPNGKKESIQAGNIRDKVIVENVEAQKAAKRAEIDARYKQQLNTFTYTDKADGAQHTIQLVSRGEDMARVVLDGVEQDIPNNVFDEIVAETTAEASGKLKGESGEQEAENAESGDVVSPVETTQPVVEQTALERVPKAENGEPVYEQADADTAWDAIMEQTNDEEIAIQVVEGMIVDKEAALKKLENAKVREGNTVAEKIAAAQQRKAAIEQAKADLAKWQEIAAVKAKRAEAAVVETAPVVESAAPSLLDVVKTLYSKGKEVASKLFQRSFFDVAKTPKFMQELGLRGDKFTIKYGVIARHLGKDSSHTLTEKDWEQLPQALQNPFAISKLTDKENSYRIYTTLQTESGEFVVVGADVKNAGREIEVNAISTVFGRRNNANLPKNEEVIYRSEEITPEQSSLLERPNFAQYPTEQELSTDEGTTQSAKVQEKAQKSDENAENESGKMYSPEELAEAKEQLGELNATSAPEFAARLFSIKPWKTLEEANAALKELLASYGETLNGQSLAVMPFLDKAQGLIREYNKSQEPRSVEEVLENGDKRITNYNSRGEVATVATERNGKVVSVDNYDEGVLFETTTYDENGVATSVTRYDKSGNVVSTQVFENSGVEKNRSGKVNTHSVIKSELEKKALRKRAEKWAKKLGVKVHVLESYDEVTNEEARVAILEQRVPGWFAGGEVYIYMPHVKNGVDLDKTVVHETVAHKGIKQLLGKEFNKFLDNVWDMMSVPARAKFLSYVGAGKNATQADRRAAADEYVASIAEKVYKEQGLTAEEKNIWQKFVERVKNFFAGKFNADEAKAEVMSKDVLDEKDIAKMVLASYSKLTENGEVKAESDGETRFSKKGENKKSPNTATQNKSVKATAVSSDLLAKVEKLKGIYNKRDSKRTRGFITDVSRELNLTKDGSSHYRTFSTPLGDITLRVSNHNSKLKEFEDRYEDEGVSIVISRKKNKRIDRTDSTGKSHVDEFFYPKQGLERSQGRPLVQILESIEEFLATGVYVDKTGLAQPEDSRGIRFRKANENQEIFVSNARKAVEEIKQEKATPQQWLAMIKKNGGLKVGEDKWMGLSEWLEEKGKLKGENGKDISLTKQEVLDFVNENAIKIEEVEYEANPNSFEALKEEYEDLVRNEGFDAAQDVMLERFGDDFSIAFDDLGGELVIANEDAAATLLGSGNIINSTRLDYTTVGLENKREIALVVPTIEPYNQSDEIHFGDAGEGRAVAWVRFGETTDSEGNRVLVIDEIQSKRHQDGREKGYKSQADKTPATMDELTFGEYNGMTTVSLRGERFFFKSSTSKNEILDIINERIAAGQLGSANGLIPAAPFEKNWQELAMKRMLRLAAEEGFDKVAWTTGEQQAERYNIGSVVEYIDVSPYKAPGSQTAEWTDVRINAGVSSMDLRVDVDGNVVSGGNRTTNMAGEKLADVVGKELADKILSTKEDTILDGESLRIGGEGMKGFYDKMLPSFVSKYTKKWGAKVGTVEMPSLEQNNVMHSVDVTPEMKESVMEGQTMFRKDSMREHAAEWADALQKQEPKQWAKIVEAMKLSPVWNMVEGDDNSRAAEVLQRLSDSRVNDLAQKEIEKARGVIEKAEAVSRWYRIKNAISDFWNWVQRNVFGTEPKNWEDFVDEVVGDFEGKTKVQRLKQRVGGLTRDILNAVFEKAGIDIELAEPAEVEQVAVVEGESGERQTESGERKAENGSVGTEENGSQAASEPQARNRNMDREAFKKAFKKGGEKAYDLMYELHGGIVSTYPQEFLAYLKEVIGVADDVANIIEGAHDYLIADFKKKNPDLFKRDETEKVEDVHSLLATKGYSLLEHTMDNGKAIGMKMMYRDKFVKSGKTDASYTPGTEEHGRTVICYYNHPEARLQNQYVFTVTKDNAMETPTAYELVADPSLMTPEWAEYLEKIGRKNEDGTFFLDGLVPNFNDPFSLSHLMIRVNKNSHDVETISRYNHGAFNEKGEYERIAGQPNATLGNNLDKLVDGLSESLMEYKQLETIGGVPLGENMIVANDGKIYRYNDIKGGVHLGNGFWIDRRGDAHVINPGKEKLVGEFLYGGGKVKNVTNGESVDIHGLKFTENGVEFYTGGEEVTETREIEIKGEKKTVTKKVIKGDAKNVITFNGDAYLETESADAETIGRVGKLYDVYSIKGDNLTEAGNGFLEDFFWVRRVDFPNLEKAGNNCFNATLTEAYLPKLREVGYNCFNRVGGRGVPSLPSLEKVGANFMYSVGLMGEDVNIDFPKLREVGNFFMKNAQPSVVSLPSLETCGDGFMKGSMRGVTVDLPNLTKAGYEFFGGGFSVQSLDAPKLTDIKGDFMEGNPEIRQQILEQTGKELVMIEDIERIDVNDSTHELKDGTVVDAKRVIVEYPEGVSTMMVDADGNVLAGVFTGQKLADVVGKKYAAEILKPGDFTIKAKEETRFRFIGTQGAENLDKAEEATTRLDNLNVAREMETGGKDAKAIKLATGWERGADGKWRYETEDDFEFDMNANVAFGKRRPGIMRMYNRWRELLHKKNALAFEGEALPADEGAEFESLSSDFNGTKLHNSRTLKDYIDAPELFEAYPQVADIKVSIEALPENEKGSYSPLENIIRLNNKLGKGEMKSTLNHEIQHAIQYIEGFAVGGNVSSASTYLNLPLRLQRAYEIVAQMDDPTVEKIYEYAQRKDISIPDKVVMQKLFFSIRDGFVSFDDVLKATKNPYGVYKHLAGEVEARNVQKRMGMSPEERRNELATETEDVSRKDQIFIFDNLGVSGMMGSRVDARMAEVASHFDGKELSAEQRSVVDVFGGKADNLTISVKTQDGNTRNVEMRQGNDLAGAKHSLYAHYGTTKGVINADDLLLIPDVIANGERTENGKKAVYKLDVNGTKYTVVTYVKQNKEEFHNFYSNKKGQPSQSVNASIGDTQSARITEELASEDKGSDNSLNEQEERTLFRKAVQDSEEARQEIESLDNEVLATIEELAQELYSNVGVIADIESIPDEKKRRDAKRGMKGWYDPATGMVSVVLPNIADKQDAVETMLHEIVGHRGLRGLLGEKYNEFLNEVFVNAPKEMRADIMKIVMAQKADGSRTPLRTAVEEYLAGIAEGGFVNNPTLWTKIMTALKQLLRSMGVKVDVSENELAYMLWRSHQLLKGGYNIEQRIIDSVMQQRMEVGEYRRRNTAFHGPMRSQGRNLAKEIELFGLRDEYEKMILSSGFQSREAFQDSMLALKKFQEMLEKATGKKLPDYFNAYYMENALSSANQAQAEAYGRLFYKKIVDEINKLKKTFKQEDIFDYLIIKHGIERNREMAVRSVLSSEENGLDRKMYNKYVAKKKEILKNAKENKLSWEETQRELDELAERFGADLSKDYSGLSAIFSKVKGKEIMKAAYNHVLEMDKKGDFANLHKAIKAATDETLEKRYSTGMLSKKTKEEILDMYEYYVPLRGFEEQTSEDVYHYMTTKSSPISSVKAARGRTSKSDNAIAWIANAAEEAIVRGNRNMMKMAFFNAVAANPNDLVSIEGDTYLELKNGQWTVAFPDIPVNATPEQVREIWDDFIKEKEQQAKANPDMVKKVSDNADIPYTVVQKGELQEHQIFVRRNGRLYTMTVNGNPRLAQAINGVTNPNTTDSKLMNRIADTVQSINSGLSRAYTTANPDFVLSNWLRDMIYSNSMVWVKESPAYAWKFNRNCGLNARGVFKLISKYENGTLDMENDVERMFHEFIINGGETGYTQLKDYEASKKELQKMLKKGIPGEATAVAVQHFAAQINRAVENAARFAAYRTSREMGRSIIQSVHDAKEISVNFNKKGAGARFFGAKGQTKTGSAVAAVSGIGRAGYVFWNAGVQGMYNFFSAWYDHKLKGTAMIFTPLLLGYLAASMGDDDDDYQNLSPYIRRSNLCFKLTDGTFLTIPLPIEYRTFYGITEYLTNVGNGNEEFNKWELAGQLSQLLPLDMLEGGGGFKAFVPSLLKPIYEVAVNKDWTGRPIAKQTDFNRLDPEYKRVYGDVSAATMAFSKMMNELGGGNPNRRADATIEIGDETYEPFEWNPAYIENTLRGYLGGMFSFPEKVVKTAGMIAGKREFDWRHVPLANRILKTSTEKAEEYKVNSNFFDNLGRFEKDWHEMRGWKKDAFDFKGTEDERESALTRYGELLDKNGKLRELYIIKSRIDKSNSLYKEFGEEAFKQQMLKYRMEFNKKFNEIYE